MCIDLFKQMRYWLSAKPFLKPFLLIISCKFLHVSYISGENMSTKKYQIYIWKKYQKFTSFFSLNVI